MKDLVYDIPIYLNVLYLGILNLYVVDLVGVTYIDHTTAFAFISDVIPSFIIFTLLLISTKKARLGSILFFITALISILFFDSYKEINSLLILSLPLFIISIGYYIREYRPY